VWLFLKFLATFIDDARPCLGDVNLYGVSLTDYFTITTFETLIEITDHCLFIFELKYIRTTDNNTVPAAGAFVLIKDNEAFRYFVPSAHDLLPLEWMIKDFFLIKGLLVLLNPFHDLRKHSGIL
jgi:hypothetical protein